MKGYSKIGILTSGGDAPGLNACIRAVVLTALACHLEVVGIGNGFDGLMIGDFTRLHVDDVENIIQRGGTILGASRSEGFRTREGRKKAFRQLKAHDIDAVILIGGDGSLEGAKIFTSEFSIPFIGIPKTIDNDVYGTDESIGYDTALNTAVEAIDKLRDTAQSHKRIFIVEVMGRNAGFLAYGAGLAVGAEAILIPETRADMVTFEQNLKRGWNILKSSQIFVVAEGDEYSGGSKAVTRLVQKYIPDHDVELCVLGHTQRGGNPSAADRILACRFGFAAIEALMEGSKNVIIGVQAGKIVFTPLKESKKRSLELKDSMWSMMNILGGTPIGQLESTDARTFEAGLK